MKLFRKTDLKTFQWHFLKGMGHTLHQKKPQRHSILSRGCPQPGGLGFSESLR